MLAVENTYLLKRRVVMITKPGIESIRKALNTLGVALADEKHTWTDKERKLYEGAIDLLDLEDMALTEVHPPKKK